MNLESNCRKKVSTHKNSEINGLNGQVPLLSYMCFKINQNNNKILKDVCYVGE